MPRLTPMGVLAAPEWGSNAESREPGPIREVPVVDRAGNEGDTGAAAGGHPASRRDLADLSEAARDLDRRIEQHLERLRHERAQRAADIPGQRLRPSG